MTPLFFSAIAATSYLSTATGTKRLNFRFSCNALLHREELAASLKRGAVQGRPL